MMNEAPQTNSDALYRHYAVVRWLEENLGTDTFGKNAVPDEGMVDRILQEGPKAIREILKESRWRHRKQDAGTLYSSLQKALKEATQESNDPLYHASWQTEEFTDTPLEVGEEQLSIEHLVEQVESIDPAVRCFKELLVKLLDTNETFQSVEQAFCSFTAECTRLHPECTYSINLADAHNRLQRSDLTPLKALCIEFNEQVCYPSNKVFSPIAIMPDQDGIEYYDAQIVGKWRSHTTPIGKIGFSANVQRVRNGNDNYVQSAMTIGNRFFLEDTILRSDSDNHYKYIQTSTEQNPYWYALRSYFRARNITADQYFQFLEQFRIIFEEHEHLCDQSCIELYKQKHPNKAQYMATTDMLIVPRGGSLPKLWEQKKNTVFKYIMENITTEFVGQLGGLIQNMRAFIKRGEMTMAFAAFLNYMGLMCDAASIKQGIVMRFRSTQEADDTLLNTPNGTYLFIGEMLTQDLDSSGSAPNILGRCQQSAEHPSLVALRLLEEVYARNARTIDERKQLL